MKMFRRISALVLCLVLLSATCIVASAATAIKTDEKGSITIYTYESKKDNNDKALDLGVTGAATGEEMEIPPGYIALEGVVYQLCSDDGTAISDKTATTDAAKMFVKINILFSSYTYKIKIYIRNKTKIVPQSRCRTKKMIKEYVKLAVTYLGWIFQMYFEYEPE